MKSIKNIHEITKAMEMIAAFRFKKAETRFSRAKPYFQEIARLASNLASSLEGPVDHPLFEKRKVTKKALVVITADKGLCGAYNANLIRAAGLWARENGGVGKFLVPIGKIGADAFRKRQTPILFSYPEKSKADLVMAKKISGDLTAAFLEKKIDSVEVLYTSLKIGGAGQNQTLPFLSLSRLAEKPANRKSGPAVDYLYEPGMSEVFLSVIERYLESFVFGLLLESLASEYNARRVAMKQATDNGEEVLDNLRILRNKTRQATITRELSEIVSGASILV